MSFSQIPFYDQKVHKLHNLMNNITVIYYFFSVNTTAMPLRYWHSSLAMQITRLTVSFKHIRLVKFQFMKIKSAILKFLLKWYTIRKATKLLKH